MKRACGCRIDPWVFGHECQQSVFTWRRRLSAAMTALAQPVGANCEPGDLYGPEGDHDRP